MVGAVRPAAEATSVKWARNGSPEGFPRGCGFTPREAIPWANAMVDAALPSSRNSRRLYFAALGCRDIRWNIGRSVCGHLLYDRFLFFLMERLGLEKFLVRFLLLS